VVERFSLVRTLEGGEVKMNRSEQWLGKVAVVTGSGAGIGAATAKWLARRGYLSWRRRMSRTKAARK